jgi:tRNA threonylcarbamoyl adenosine modification protein YeaZ
MRVLALDSAFGGISVAAAEGNSVVASLTAGPDAKAAETLPGLVAAVLADLEWRIGDVDRFAVTLGPGGFTSLRAGLAFAKGLALGARKPLLGFTTLEALAVSATPDSAPIAAVIDAKRDEVFFQMFAAELTPLSDAAVVPVEDLAAAFAWPLEFRVCGSGARFVIDAGLRCVDTGVIAPQASALALHCQKFDPAMRPAEAVYLRPADARPMA